MLDTSSGVRITIYLYVLNWSSQENKGCVNLKRSKNIVTVSYVYLNYLFKALKVNTAGNKLVIYQNRKIPQ